MNESISALLLLIVFIGLSILRTGVENRASHENTKEGIGRVVAVYFRVTFFVLVCANIFVVVGLALPQVGHLCLHGLALLIAVLLGLLAGGEPQTPQSSGFERS